MTMRLPIEFQAGTAKKAAGNGRRKNAALWIVQGVLAALFLFTGGMKLFVPLNILSKQMPIALPGVFVRFLGASEILGAVGLILPGLLRIRRELTLLAASGLIVIMVGAITYTLAGGGGWTALMPFAVGVLLAWVARGRREYLPGFLQNVAFQAKTSEA